MQELADTRWMMQGNQVGSFTPFISQNLRQIPLKAAPIRFEQYRYVTALIALGLVLGIGASYLCFNRQIDGLNDRIDLLNQCMLLYIPILGAPTFQPDQSKKKHGPH